MASEFSIMSRVRDDPVNQKSHSVIKKGMYYNENLFGCLQYYINRRLLFLIRYYGKSKALHELC